MCLRPRRATAVRRNKAASDEVSEKEDEDRMEQDEPTSRLTVRRRRRRSRMNLKLSQAPKYSESQQSATLNFFIF